MQQPIKKMKYFVFGALAMATLVPLAIYAVDTIPIKFSEGDVISANVMNTLLQRLNDTTSGFTSSSDIVGTWACTTYSLRNTCQVGFVKTPGGLLSAKTQNVVFSCNGNTCAMTPASFTPDTCGDTMMGSRPVTSQNYELNGNVMALVNNGLSAVQKLSPSKFVWQLSNSFPQQEYTVCEKAAAVPAPANGLTATVSGTNVVLVWTDNSSDETGFKVQYKMSATADWTTSTTTAANATSYTVSGLKTGTYWFRIIATNNNGDAMSSSEVQATIQ